MYFFIFSFLCIFIYFLLYYNVIENGAETYPVSIILFSLNLLFFFLAGLKREKTIYTFWIRPSYILILSLIVVNLQNIVNVVFEIAPISFYLNTYQYNNYVSKVCYLGLIAITAFLIGNYKLVNSKIPFVPNFKPQIKKWDMRFWTLFCLIMFVMFVINIDIIAFVTGTDYIGSGAADRIMKKSAYYEQLFEVGIIILSAIYIQKRTQDNISSFKEYIGGFPILFLIILFCYLVLRLMSGDRGPVIYNVFILFYGYVLTTKKKFKFVTVVSALLLVGLCITLLNFVRMVEDDESFIERVNNSYSKMQNEEKRTRSVLPVSQELANSIKCNFIAVHDIEKNKTEFKFGEYNIYNVIGSIPGSRFVLSNVFGVDLIEKSSAEYLTRSLSGEDYSFGLGTSAVAEAYLDFGLLGTFVLFLLFGILYKKLDLNMLDSKNVSIIQTIVILRFASYAIYTPRFSFTGTLSKALYIVIIYALVTYMLRMLTKKNLFM